jgi:hypothetical protein
MPKNVSRGISLRAIQRWNAGFSDFTFYILNTDDADDTYSDESFSGYTVYPQV